MEFYKFKSSLCIKRTKKEKKKKYFNAKRVYTQNIQCSGRFLHQNEARQVFFFLPALPLIKF